MLIFCVKAKNIFETISEPIKIPNSRKDWRRVVFVERDSADSGTDENDELAEEGEETTVADQLLYAILTEMRRQLIAKMERTVREARFRFFWTDQIRILDRFIDGK